MLPKLHHPHDRKWIEEQLRKLPPSALATAIKGYEKVFSESYDSEPMEHRKENKARFTANTRLREYVDKVIVRAEE